jgi:hypothetical protein
MGTGSYVERTLFWYRSSLAHNAPLVDGRSQERVHGRLIAYEDRGAAGWVDATVDGIAPGVTARRTVVVMPDYALDELQWTAHRDVTVDVPFHVDGELRGGGEWRPGSLTGGAGPEDGFDFVHDAEVCAAPALAPMCLAAISDAKALDVWLQLSAAAQWWRASAPGPPGSGDRRFHVARARAQRGRVRSIWSWSGEVAGVAFEPDAVRVTLADGTTHIHSRRAAGWHVDFVVGGARSSIDLDGAAHDDQAPELPTIGVYGDATHRDARSQSGPAVILHAHPSGDATDSGGAAATAQPVGYGITLGEAHYRRSEVSWAEAGSPTARVSLGWTGLDLHVDVDVRKPSAPIFVAADAVNPYDNEPPDINGDGIQMYLRAGDESGAWVLVPEGKAGTVRVRSVPGWGALPAPRASWRPTAHGYTVHVVLPLREKRAARSLPIALDVLINETSPGRARRRGQLVMSGADGEFVYLAGDRHDPARLMPFVLEP